MATYLINSKRKDEKAQHILAIIANTITLFGEKVYIQTNDYSYFEKLNIDEEIEIIIKDKNISQMINHTTISLPIYTMKYKDYLFAFLLQNKETGLIFKKRERLETNESSKTKPINSGSIYNSSSYPQSQILYNPFSPIQNQNQPFYSQAINNSSNKLDELFPRADLTKLNASNINVKDLNVQEFSPLPKIGK